MRIYGIFQTSCPSGWTLETGWNGYLLMGASAYDNTQRGSATHRHSVTLTGKIGGTAQVTTKYGPHTPGGVRIHRQADPHDVDHLPTYSGYADNLPPYLNVVYCYQEV